MLHKIANPEAIAALREHREDRNVLLASLTASIQADFNVGAAWLWGSFGRGEEDDLSDLDLWLIVADDGVSAMGTRLHQFALQTGNLINDGEKSHLAPPGGGFFSSLHEGRHGLLHLDCYWQPQSAIIEVPDRAVLFNRLDKLDVAPLQRPMAPVVFKAPTDEKGRIVQGIGFAWLMLSITAKTLARNPASDMSLLTYPRPGLEDVATILGLDGFIASSDWLVHESALKKIECLRILVSKTEYLTLVANEQGLDLSLLNAVCLNRYLDMVKVILQ